MPLELIRRRRLRRVAASSALAAAVTLGPQLGPQLGLVSLSLRLTAYLADSGQITPDQPGPPAEEERHEEPPNTLLI